VATTYCFDLTIVLYCSSLTFQVSAIPHRAVPTTTGYHVTLSSTEPRYSQQIIVITYSTTQLAKSCQAYHSPQCLIMPQQQNALLIEHKGRLQLALQADHSRSQLAAARAFNVKHQNLSDRARGIPFILERRPNGQKLTLTEEETIVQYVFDID
jgi:hypothetical protein